MIMNPRATAAEIQRRPIAAVSVRMIPTMARTMPINHALSLTYSTRASRSMILKIAERYGEPWEGLRPHKWEQSEPLGELQGEARRPTIRRARGPGSLAALMRRTDPYLKPVATLLQQMQDDATDHEIPLATLLRKALILSRRLDYAPVGEWAQRELEGYPVDVDLPPYRAYRSCHVVGDLNGVGGGRMTNQPLQSSVVAEEYRRGLFGFELRDGVPAYEAMVDEGENVSFPWAMDVVAHYQSSFIQGWGLANARRVLSGGEIRQLLDAIRTRLLSFTLEIEAANPDAGEATGGEEPVPLQEVGSAFAVHVMGDHNIINAAGGDAIQTISFDDGRWDELRRTLAGLGVPDQEVSALRVALGGRRLKDTAGGDDGPLDCRVVRAVEHCSR